MNQISAPQSSIKSKKAHAEVVDFVDLIIQIRSLKALLRDLEPILEENLLHSETCIDKQCNCYVKQYLDKINNILKF